MATGAKYRYQRLIQESVSFEADDEDHHDHHDYKERVNNTIVKSRSWFRLRRGHIKRGFRLKIPSLRRLVLRKKKFRVVSAVRLSCAKVVKRLKESQAHFGDLFAGNYLFLQINPTPMKSIKKRYSNQASNEFHNLHGFSSTYSFPRIGDS